ncbi:MAG: ECF transporter S component, partial [bacterium]|nr:ECF transporter S component [bacterium]
MKLSTKAVVQTGILLAICIASQFIKGLSVYITGPIVNLTIVMAVLLVGLSSGIILSVIAPITAFWISPSPITQSIPMVIPCIMIGNILLAVGIYVFQKKVLTNKMKLNMRVAIGMVTGSLAKAVFMGVSIVCILLPMFKGNLPAKKADIIMNAAKVTFSVTQFITAIIGCAIGYVIWLRIK